MQIGSLTLSNNLILAPMAGVTDRPFRQLCRQLGAGLAVSEMVSANPDLRMTRKSRLRLDHQGEPGPRAVQIAGADPHMLADAARYNADQGAEIIDINMGCPAKKVCNVYAGSALLQDEALVARILTTVVAAVDVPVTLKIRTGWQPQNKNAIAIARIAEHAGIRMLTVHGRTRACAFRGDAEHDTARHVKQAVQIPVVANGDIRTPQQARQILAQTGADGLMIGRGAQGNPWIFRDIQHFLITGKLLPPPAAAEVLATLRGHLENLYAFYGEYQGVRIARKHIAWYCRHADDAAARQLRQRANQAEHADQQLAWVEDCFNGRLCTQLPVGHESVAGRLAA